MILHQCSCSPVGKYNHHQMHQPLIVQELQLLRCHVKDMLMNWVCIILLYTTAGLNVTLKYYIHITLYTIICIMYLVRVPLMMSCPPNIFCLYIIRGFAPITQGCNSFHDIVIFYDMTKKEISFLRPIKRLKMNVKQKYNTSNWFYMTYTHDVTSHYIVPTYLQSQTRKCVITAYYSNKKMYFWFLIFFNF